MTIALVPLTGLGAAQTDGAGNQSYVAVQDGECVQLNSFTDNQSAVEYYDYRLPSQYADNPYVNATGSAFGSEGTIDLQEPDTSIVFLYTDTNDTATTEDDITSLVLVHGEEANENSTGGAATFTITNLPEDGEWTVRDDDYNDTTSEDVWNVTETETTVDWVWSEAATDGGVFSGLENDTNVTIEPAFNDEAGLANSTNATVDNWQVLSNNTTDDNVTRTDLELDESLQVAAGTCTDDGFETTDDNVTEDNETEDNVTVENATVEFEDQESTGTTVTVDNVTLPRDGYVAIHNDSLLDGDAVGSVIGVSDYLEAGTYEDLTVDLYDVPGADFNESELTENQTLIAMPHEETTGDESYDFVSSNGTDDGPYTADGAAVTDDANITIVNDTADNETATPADNETATPADNETATPADNETATP